MNTTIGPVLSVRSVVVVVVMWDSHVTAHSQQAPALTSGTWLKACRGEEARRQKALGAKASANDTGRSAVAGGVLALSPSVQALC